MKNQTFIFYLLRKGVFLLLGLLCLLEVVVQVVLLGGKNFFQRLQVIFLGFLGALNQRFRIGIHLFLICFQPV